VSTIAAGYASLGHDVHVIARAPEPGSDSGDELVSHCTRMSRPPRVLRWGELPVDELRTWTLFRKLSRPQTFDLVEVIDWSVPALTALRTVRHGPVVVKLHGPSAFVAELNRDRMGPLARTVARRERMIAERADLLISADEGLAQRMAGKWSLPKVPDTVPDPVMAAPLARNPPSRELSVLAVGRLERRKDQATLVRALNRLTSRSIEFQATFVGPDTPTGPQGTSYQQHMRELCSEAVATRVRFVPHASLDELQALYAKSSVAVVCTVDGNYGYSTLDAMAAGVPVVTTIAHDRPSPYITPGDTALVYEVGDDEALAKALERVADDPHQASELGLRARAHVLDHLSPATIAGEVLERVGLAGR
jgi:glycosyltransferase involved in cell wall biosynthesis